MKRGGVCSFSVAVLGPVDRAIQGPWLTRLELGSNGFMDQTALF